MHQTHQTKVKGEPKDIFDQFDQRLFEFLNPALFGVEVLFYQGQNTGDQFSLKLPLFGQLWEGRITDHHVDENECYFIDQGEKLPFPLKKWRHKHLIKAATSGESLIIDQVEFEGSFLFKPLIYVAFYIMFLNRKPKYREYFKGKK